MAVGRWWTGLVFLAFTAVAAGIVRAESSNPAAGVQVAGILQTRLGAAPEWAAVVAVEPAAAVAQATEALAAWLQRRWPATEPLAASGLSGHLARRAAREAGVWTPREFWAGVQADAVLVQAERARGATVAAGRPEAAPSPAVYAAEARLFWYRYEWVQRPRGESLWTALAAADAGGKDALSYQLVRRLWGYWTTYVTEGRPTPLDNLLADVDGDGLPAGLEAEMGTDPDKSDTDEDSLPDGSDPEPLVRGIAVWVDGQPLDLADAQPLVADGQVMLPLRPVFTALGAEVRWDPATVRAEASRAGRSVRLQADTSRVLIRDGQRRRRVTLPAAPRLVGDRLYVPLHVVSEALGAAVEWQGATRSVRVTSGAAPALAPADPRKIVYLTIDDGPSLELTGRVLDILADYEVPATFFVVGTNVVRNPALVRRMVAEGHAVGNHSWDHNWDNVYASPQSFAESLERAGAAIAAATGQQPPLLARVPGGRGTGYLNGRDRAAYWAEAAYHGYVLFDWNVSIGDAAPGQLVPARGLLENLRRGVQMAGPGPYVVLMHDAPSHHTPTVEALPRLIEWLEDEGYEFGVLTPDVTVGR